MHGAHGLSSIPPFRSTAQITTSGHAARYARMTFTMPDFPAPVVPPIRACRRRNRTCTGWPSSDRPSSAGRVMEVLVIPGHGIAAACGSFSITRNVNRSARDASGTTRYPGQSRPTLNFAALDREATPQGALDVVGGEPDNQAAEGGEAPGGPGGGWVLCASRVSGWRRVIRRPGDHAAGRRGGRGSQPYLGARAQAQSPVT